MTFFGPIDAKNVVVHMVSGIKWRWGFIRLPYDLRVGPDHIIQDREKLTMAPERLFFPSVRHLDAAGDVVRIIITSQVYAHDIVVHLFSSRFAVCIRGWKILGFLHGGAYHGIGYRSVTDCGGLKIAKI